MNSMTGFGKAEITTKDSRCRVEISSFNNRFLELSIRLPRQLSTLEAQLRELVSHEISRGKVTLFVGFEERGARSQKYNINMDALRAYHQQLKSAKKKLGLTGVVEIKDLLIFSEAHTLQSENVDEKKVWLPVKKAASRAIAEMSAMRHKEGSALAKDMSGRLNAIEKILKKVKSEAHSAVEKYRKKLAKRVDELLQSRSVDKGRLEEEVVIFAERADITEECTRFESHVSQYRKALKSKEPVGKKLNFILQEMNREANTIASKCSELKIARAALDLREEIEKLREQVQNVE